MGRQAHEAPGGQVDLGRQPIYQELHLFPHAAPHINSQRGQPGWQRLSINARIRKAVRARGHFPTDQAALKCVYLAVMSLDPTGTGRKRWTMRWKAALQAFDITFDGRLTAGRR
jgi:hypothetical protein